MQRAIALLLAMSPLFAQSEVYRDIGPLDTLGDVKAKFPGATSKKLSPAWAQPTDAMYQLNGTGISGTIIVKFTDGRPNYREQLEAGPDEGRVAFLQRLVNETDEDALSVSWVRWIPDSPFPLQRLVTKYGPPEKSGFSDENYQPYRNWERKGLSAFLSDDEKNVVRLDFSFTNEEQRKAWVKKHQFVPDWLKEEPAPARKK